MNIYIHTNNKQSIGAKVAKYLWEEIGCRNVEIINVDELGILDGLWNEEYLRGGKIEKFSKEDLQSFTMSRFYPEKITRDDYIVTDPDVFPTCASAYEAIKIIASDATRNPLNVTVSEGKAGFNSSVMIRSAGSRRLWDFDAMLTALLEKQADYNDFILLKFVTPLISLVDERFNSFDILNDNTLLLHNTGRLTQPWKEGLPVDFINHKQSPASRLSKQNTLQRYKRHPDEKQIKFFMAALARAVKAGSISQNELELAASRKYVRQDIVEVLEKYS